MGLPIQYLVGGNLKVVLAFKLSVKRYSNNKIALTPLIEVIIGSGFVLIAPVLFKFTILLGSLMIWSSYSLNDYLKNCEYSPWVGIHKTTF